MHAVVLGASRGCGRYAAIDILASLDNTITLLLRKPEAVTDDEILAPFVKEGRCKVVQGDATKEEDLHELFADKVDVLVSGIGGVPHMTVQGLQLDSPLCTTFSLALVKVLASLPAKPRLVVISSMGMGGSHDSMPLIHRVMYAWFLHGPHEDKEGLELVLKKAAKGFPTPFFDSVTVPGILTPQAYASVPEDIIDELVLVRPAWLNDGEYSGGARGGEGITVSTVSRRDVGRFIAEECMSKDTWVNKAPTVGQ